MPATGSRPSPPARPQRADARRNTASILDAAVLCLTRNPDASVAEIAKAASVGRVTLYGHFKTRAELVDGLCCMGRLWIGPSIQGPCTKYLGMRSDGSVLRSRPRRGEPSTWSASSDQQNRARGERYGACQPSTESQRRSSLRWRRDHNDRHSPRARHTRPGHCPTYADARGRPWHGGRASGSRSCNPRATSSRTEAGTGRSPNSYPRRNGAYPRRPGPLQEQDPRAFVRAACRTFVGPTPCASATSRLHSASAEFMTPSDAPRSADRSVPAQGSHAHGV